jgi:hypothetical protein
MVERMLTRGEICLKKCFLRSKRFHGTRRRSYKTFVPFRAIAQQCSGVPSCRGMRTDNTPIIVGINLAGNFATAKTSTGPKSHVVLVCQKKDTFRSLFDTRVAKTFGGPDDWRVGPVTTFLQGGQPVSRRAQRRVAAVALALQQPEIALESAGIRNLRPMFARLWPQEEYLRLTEAIGRRNMFVDGIGEARFVWDSPACRMWQQRTRQRLRWLRFKSSSQRKLRPRTI